MCKRVLGFLFTIMLGVLVRSEAQQLNYQAIARNANGVALTFRDVGIRLSIRDGSQTGSIVYSETRNVRTNQFGLFTVVIGSPGASNVLGSMASINWISGNKYLQVEIDPEGGNNYFQAGTSQLQAVPYALFANAAYPVGPAGGDLLGSTYPNPIIAPLAVTTTKIANQAVTTPKIADLNVTTAKLADQAITNPKIQDNTIANIKLVNSKVTLNGLILNLGDSQDFAVGKNGTDVNIISAGTTHTFNFPDASIANRGLITPNAQTIGGNKTFNNDIIAARIIRAGGIAAQFLKADGSVDNNSYLTNNQPIIVTATGDATGVSTSSGTAPILPLTLATVNSAVGTFGNNITIPTITANNKGLITNITSNPIPTATATTSGLLTVGDWNTFNNKQNAIPLGTSTQYFKGDLTLGNFTNDVRNQLSAGTNITYANGNIGLTNNSVTINSLPLALGGSQSFATGSTGNDFNISSTGTVHSFNIPTASATNRGLLSSNDFSNFNTAYTSRITGLTTTGSNGAATLGGNVLNIPNYTLAGLGGEPSITSGNSLQYWRGDKTWQTLNTTSVPEGTQQYFTNNRARNAISLTTLGTTGIATYDNNTGVINIPNYSATGIGAEPTITAGTALQYWRGDKTWQTLTSDVATEGSTNLYFSNARARNSLSLTTTGTNGSATFNNATGVFNIPSYTLNGLGGEPSITAGTTAQYWRGDKSWQALTSDAATEGSTNLYFTNSRAQNAITLSTNNSSGAATYSGGTLNIPNYSLAGLGGEPTITAGTALQYWRGDKSWQTLNTSIVQEGTNEYFTQTRARNAISLTTNNNSGASTYDNSTGIFNIPTYTFDGLSPMTSSGDLIIGGTSGAGTRLPKGTDGQVLTLASGLPGWVSYSGWKVDGNTGLNPASDNFLGTTDAVQLKFKVENTNSGTITTLTGGKLNTSFGLGTSIFSNTGAEKNSAFGAGALNSITTGVDNTAIGQGSLSVLQSNNNNTAVGQSALANNTAESNTAVGQASLQTNTSGFNNSALGKDALFTNSIGSYNTAIGHFALRSSTGSNNSALGQNALGSLSTGANNVAIGYQAGKYFNGIEPNNLTTSTNSIYIGTNAGPSINTASNQIVIGYNAIGNGDNTVQLGNTSILKVNTSGAMNATKFVGKSGATATSITSIDGNTSNVVFAGNDAAGTITFQTTSAIGVGDFITIDFGSDYENTPVVIIHAIEVTGSAATTRLMTEIFCRPTNTNTANFKITTNSALTPGRTYEIAYHVIGR